MEQWKQIDNAPYVECSNLGQFRSVTRTIGRRTYPGQPLKISAGRINLKIGEKTLTRTAHVIVYRTWIGQVPPGSTVNFVDGDKTNRSVSNLQMYTTADKVFDIIQQRAEGSTIKQLATTFNCSGSYIEKILAGKRGRPSPVRSELLQMESNGCSYAAIGNHFNITEPEAKQRCAVERNKVRRY